MKCCWPIFLLAPLAGCRRGQAGGSGGDTPPAEGAVRAVECVPDGTHRRLRVGLHLTNAGPSPLTAGPPAVQLLSDGRPVPAFIAPGTEPATIAPGQSADVDTYWWLTEEEAARPVSVQIGGSTSPVTWR